MLIVQLAANSDAYAGGLRRYDVVTAFNGQTVTDPSQLFRLVSDAEIGTTGTLTVLRQGEQLDVRVPIVGSTRQR
ncbi:MAG: PDZ domain-containing protein [Vicinamibacterales bacterium]